MMNNRSSSSGTSSASKKVIGIPSACWCGAAVSTMVSKSERNPYRRFYRCAYAVSEKLFGDNHLFKWTDEAVVNALEALHCSIDRVENAVMEQLEETLMDMAENFVMNKVEHLVMVKVEHLVMAKVEKLVQEKVEQLVKEKVDHLVMEKLDNLVMEKVQEELLCMKLSE